MSNKNTKRRGPKKLKINEVILPSYTELSKSCVYYIKKFDCNIQYISDMLKDLTDSRMRSYPLVKEKNSNFYPFFNE